MTPSYVSSRVLKLAESVKAPALCKDVQLTSDPSKSIQVSFVAKGDEVQFLVPTLHVHDARGYLPPPGARERSICET